MLLCSFVSTSDPSVLLVDDRHNASDVALNVLNLVRIVELVDSMLETKVEQLFLELLKLLVKGFGTPILKTKKASARQKAPYNAEDKYPTKIIVKLHFLINTL